MPLLWAAYQGHLDVAQVLVDAGAALSATDKVRCRSAAPLRQLVSAAGCKRACSVGSWSPFGEAAAASAAASRRQLRF